MQNPLVFKVILPCNLHIERITSSYNHLLAGRVSL